jgi:hypothetical protein
MALRFRKSIKLAPGVRWNLSGSGSSFSFGPRGASISTGKRGTYLNAGIPGTGLSSRSLLQGPQAPRSQVSPAAAAVKLTCSVNEDGTLTFVDEAGNAASEHLIEVAKKQNREGLAGFIQIACDRVNGEVEALGQLHLATPHPDDLQRFVEDRFEEAMPTAPIDKKPGFVAGMFAGRRDAIERANEAAREIYRRAHNSWTERKRAHEAEQERRRKFIEADILTDPAAMESYLEERLQGIEWPRETSAAFEVRDAGLSVALDVDLPEVEDMPSKVAAVPARGMRLSIKDMPATKVQRLYLNHVHGIIFRLVGEVFAALPTVGTVLASGYSQRPDPATGRVNDEYLLSVRVTRSQWRKLDFRNLAAVDVVEALGAMGAVRSIQRSGKLLAVQPLNG